MRSIILVASTRIFFIAMLLVSLWILLRGHNEPGGGFIGGLMGAAAFATLAFAAGVDDARKMLRIHPAVLMGVGLVLGAVSGLPGVVLNGSYLQHQWLEMDLGLFELKLGTTLVFDIGVYFVVIGGVLSFMFRLYEEEQG
ncbi:MAG: Na+/H+ antiporter subunit B [Salinarimonas sp.]|nr:Na+/H+ antiporter subunit B [Salinarimonas sp.]